MASPTVHHLYVLVTGDQMPLAAAQQAWAEFEAWTALPFTYSELTFGVSNASASSAYAETQVQDGVATIRVTPKCLGDLPIERHLTLLHESLHIASFVGPLREMYEAVNNFARRIGTRIRSLTG